MTKQNLFKLGAKAMTAMRKPFFPTNFAKDWDNLFALSGMALWLIIAARGVSVVWASEAFIRNDVKDLVDMFIHAWLSVNPKPNPEPSKASPQKEN